MDIPPDIAEIIAPHYVLPAQFMHTAGSPQKALMHAVLVRAVHDLTAKHGEHRLRTAALAWFASDDTAWPFSFVNICQALNLDAGALRRALLQPQQEAA